MPFEIAEATDRLPPPQALPASRSVTLAASCLPVRKLVGRKAMNRIKDASGGFSYYVPQSGSIGYSEILRNRVPVLNSSPIGVKYLEAMTDNART